MTFGKFFGLGFVLAILAAAIKVFYFQALNPDSVGVMYVLGVFLVIITIACVRRLGVINYLEAFLTAGMWFLFQLFFDFLITTQVVGLKFYTRYSTWIAYALVVLTVILFHKKRHIQIRKEHAAHGGHH
jgi:hypothetical protein